MNIEGVLQVIMERCLYHPTPSRRGRGKERPSHRAGKKKTLSLDGRGKKGEGDKNKIGKTKEVCYVKTTKDGFWDGAATVVCSSSVCRVG
jgi:hypothetical protein